MNQTLLTRLFKSIEGNREEPLVRIAYTIIDDERRKGHTKLADRLDTILEGNLAKIIEPQQNLTLKLTRNRDDVFSIPADRRYKLPLATHIESDFLRHDMVLAPSVEEKVLRIEKEYIARERLAHHGLKPRQKILLYEKMYNWSNKSIHTVCFNLNIICVVYLALFENSWELFPNSFGTC